MISSSGHSRLWSKTRRTKSLYSPSISSAEVKVVLSVDVVHAPMMELSWRSTVNNPGDCGFSTVLGTTYWSGVLTTVVGLAAVEPSVAPSPTIAWQLCALRDMAFDFRGVAVRRRGRWREVWREVCEGENFSVEDWSEFSPAPPKLPLLPPTTTSIVLLCVPLLRCILANDGGQSRGCLDPPLGLSCSYITVSRQKSMANRFFGDWSLLEIALKTVIAPPPCHLIFGTIMTPKTSKGASSDLL